MIEQARAALENLTPLKTDCGRLCAAACCQADENGQGGMILFPGEAQLYDPAPAWARIEPIVYGGMILDFLSCEGHCDRENRPLACRIFPLAPVLRQGQLSLELDRRAFCLCPLLEYGIQGLDPAFVQTVHEAMTLLAQDKACRQYLLAQTHELDSLMNF